MRPVTQGVAWLLQIRRRPCFLLRPRCHPNCGRPSSPCLLRRPFADASINRSRIDHGDSPPFQPQKKGRKGGHYESLCRGIPADCFRDRTKDEII